MSFFELLVHSVKEMTIIKNNKKRSKKQIEKILRLLLELHKNEKELFRIG